MGRRARRRNHSFAGIFACAAATLTAWAAASPAEAAAYQQKVLYAFCARGASCADGTQPKAGVIIVGKGDLYGTTAGGGVGPAKAFELAPNPTRTRWTEQVISVVDYSPSGLISDGEGNLYGTTSLGSAEGLDNFGVVFELTPNSTRTGWTGKVLYGFCSEKNCSDGGNPVAGLILDAKGNLYGTTYCDGHDCKGYGLVFELIPNTTRTKWAERVLYRFCSQKNCVDGANPAGSLIMDSKGNLYGTTSCGGSGFQIQYGVCGSGVVFELTAGGSGGNWTENILHTFCRTGAPCTDGAAPVPGLIRDSAGDLYGTTQGGGSAGSGVAFELTPDGTESSWTETVLHSFCEAGEPCVDGDGPKAGLIMDRNGNLYGTTVCGGNGAVAVDDCPVYGGSGSGVAYELAPNSTRTKWTETVLHSFCNAGGQCTDGDDVIAGMIIDRQGNLFGTTQYGGRNDGGVVFELERLP